MGALSYIFNYAFSSMFLGIVLTILGLTAFFLLIKGWYKDRMFNVWSIVIGGVLFCLLCVQNVLLCGAYHIKGMAEDLEECAENFVAPYVQFGNREMTLEEVDNFLMGDLVAKYPIITEYVGGVKEFYGYRASEVPRALVDMLNEFLNRYMLRRLGWSLLFVIVGAVIVIMTMEKGYSRSTRSTGRRSREALPSRHERVASRRNSRY